MHLLVNGNKQGNIVVPQSNGLRMGFRGTYGPNDDTKLEPGDVVSISLLPCDSVLYRAGKLSTPDVIGIILDDFNMGVFNFLDAAVSDQYSVCICPKGEWVKKGLDRCPMPVRGCRLEVQDSVTSLVVNQVSGDSLTIPKGWCEGANTSCVGPTHQMSYLNSATTRIIGGLSLISVDKSCLMSADNPKIATAIASGRLLSDSVERNIVSRLDPLHQMKAGWSQFSFSIFF